MTKEERLASVGLTNTPEGVAQFYDWFPDMESHDNYMANGGSLSGAPHNGQPTAKEFFSYGSHANDGINIPMGNPLYLAYGGIPMDQQEGGFIDYNNNTTYPTFSQGGYDYEDGGMMNNSSDNYIYNYGGMYAMGGIQESDYQTDPGNLSSLLRQQRANNAALIGIRSSFGPKDDTTNTDDLLVVTLNRHKDFAKELANKIKNHPDNIKKEEDGGSVINLINALTKAKKKAYGGANVQPGGNQSHIENLRSTFDGVINNNVHNALINEQADAVKEMYRTGGLMQAETGTGVNPSFSAGYDNQVKQNAFKQNVDKYDNALNGSFSDLVYSNKRNNYYPNYYQGMNYMPMNYSPMNKISKEDDAMYKALQKNPSSRLTGYKNKSYLNGLFGKTEFTFGYKDQNAGPIQLKGEAPAPYKGAFDPNSGIPKRTYGPEEGYNFQKDATIKNPYLLNDTGPRSFVQPNSVDPNQQVFPSYRKIDYMHKYLDGSKQNIQPTSGPNSSMQNAMNNSFEATDTAVQQMKDQGIKNEYKKDPEVDLTENINNQVIDPNNELWKNHFKKQKQESLRHLTKPASDIQNLFNSKSTQGNQPTSNIRNSIDAELKEKSKQFDELKPSDKFDATGETNKNQIEFSKEQQSAPWRYGGYKAQYGKDHKSTNIMDGTYDNYGNIISSGSNGMTGGWGTSFGNTTPTTSGMFPGGPTAAKTTPALAGMPSMPAGSNPAIGITMSGTSGTEANDKLAPILKQTTTDLGNASGKEKQAKITSKQRPNFNPEAVVNWTNTGMDIVSNIFNKAQDRSQEQLAAMQLGDNSFNVNNQENRGPYDINSGDFNVKYGGYMQQGGYPQQSAQQPNQEQIVQGVAQMLQQGAQPEEIAQQLIQMGLPQEEAMQLIQAVMQQLQGSQQQQPMQYGGYSMDEEDEESYEDDLTEDEIAELRNGGYNVQYI